MSSIQKKLSSRKNYLLRKLYLLGKKLILSGKFHPLGKVLYFKSILSTQKIVWLKKHFVISETSLNSSQTAHKHPNQHIPQIRTAKEYYDYPGITTSMYTNITYSTGGPKNIQQCHSQFSCCLLNDVTQKC